MMRSTCFVLALITRGQQDKCQVFTSMIINSATISFFDNNTCVSCNGSVRLDASSDVTHAQLTEAFKNIEIIIGMLEVVNTSFTNLSFFGPLNRLDTDLEDHEHDLLIADNAKLESMDGALLTFGTRVRIINNPLLDPNCSHVVFYYYLERRIRGNRLNCGCELDEPLTATYTETLEDNCGGIYGNFVLPSIDQPTPELLELKFGNATNLVGELTVVGTDFVDLSFLRNVRQIMPNYTGVKDKSLLLYIRIQNNSKLERLGWDLLQELVIVAVSISNNPKLCYLMNELDALLTTAEVDALQGRICEVEPAVSEASTQCRIGSEGNLNSIAGGCLLLIGRLTIDHSSSPFDFWKLYNVTKIFGQLTVRNASIKGLSMLWQLRQIVNLAPNKTALIVESNRYMRSAFIRDIELILSDQPVQIENNTVMRLLEDECTALGRSVDVSSAGNRKNCPARSKIGSALLEPSRYGPILILVVFTRTCLLCFL